MHARRGSVIETVACIAHSTVKRGNIEGAVGEYQASYNRHVLLLVCFYFEAEILQVMSGGQVRNTRGDSFYFMRYPEHLRETAPSEFHKPLLAKDPEERGPPVLTEGKKRECRAYDPPSITTSTS